MKARRLRSGVTWRSLPARSLGIEAAGPRGGKDRAVQHGQRSLDHGMPSCAFIAGLGAGSAALSHEGAALRRIAAR